MAIFHFFLCSYQWLQNVKQTHKSYFRFKNSSVQREMKAAKQCQTYYFQLKNTSSILVLDIWDPRRIPHGPSDLV